MRRVQAGLARWVPWDAHKLAVFSAAKQTRWQAMQAEAGGGRYGPLSGRVGESFYSTEELREKEDEAESVLRGRSRRPFMLGLTTRAMINRNRQRIGLPPVINWKKFTSEAIRVRDELCGLDDPRARQQLEREMKSKVGSTWHDRGNLNPRQKPFAKYAQSSSMQRIAPTRHPVKQLINLRPYQDAINLSRIVNDSNRQSVCDTIKALGRPPPRPEQIKYVARPPVVTVMGHVDHGKTTLLDTLRKSDVAKGEAGGITQAIGAFRVAVPGHDTPITFIDTPGHEAFESMREAGASATDLVILVIAINEGLKPQSIDVVKLIKRLDLPVVVAFTKADLVADNVDHLINKVGNELFEYGIQLESMGGDVMSAAISAKTGQGINNLLESVLLQAEVLELVTPTPCRAEAVVLETKAKASALIPGRQPTFDEGESSVSVIVKRGVFKPQMNVIAGELFIRVTKILDESGVPLQEATPGQPVSFVGFGQKFPAPNSMIIDAGRRVSVGEWKTFWQDFNRARIAKEQWFDVVQREERLLFWEPRPDIPDEALKSKQRRDDTPQLRLILKASTQGMAEAMEQAVGTIPRLPRVIYRVISKGVGDINDHDGELYNQRPEVSMVIGANVSNRSLSNFKHDPVVVDVIYDMIQAIKERCVDFYPLKVIDTEQARVEVKEIFTFSKERDGNVGGSFVKEGSLNIMGKTKVLRGGVEVFREDEGCIRSIRHHKEEVAIVEQGSECGIILNNGFRFEPGDVLVQFKTSEVRPTVDEIFAEAEETAASHA